MCIPFFFERASHELSCSVSRKGWVHANVVSARRSLAPHPYCRAMVPLEQRDVFSPTEPPPRDLYIQLRSLVVGCLNGI